jgi:hypothetical protein
MDFFINVVYKKIKVHSEIDTNSKMVTKQNYNATCNLLGFKSKEK